MSELGFRTPSDNHGIEKEHLHLASQILLPYLSLSVALSTIWMLVCWVDFVWLQLLSFCPLLLV